METDQGSDAMTYLVRMQMEEQDEDCTLRRTNVFLNGDILIEEDENASLINGDLTFVIDTDEYGMWFTVNTEDEVMDGEVCETEPLSGTNTMSNGTDTMVYTFDGLDDCDPEPTQMLSINGEESVEVEGSSCSVVDPKASFLATLLAFSLGLFRRDP